MTSSVAHPGTIYTKPADTKHPNSGMGTGFADVPTLMAQYKVDAVVTNRRHAAEDGIPAARRRAPANVTCVLADVLEPLPADHYDAIVSITALHHVPLADALRRLAPALRPGGVLAAVVLPRSDLPRRRPPKSLPRRLIGRSARHSPR
jgi:SAM-dependent methyltransferase